MSAVASHIAFVGGGNMARSLIGALIRSGRDARSISVAEPDAVLREALTRDFGVATHADARGLASDVAVVVLAVKPQVLKSMCAGLAGIGSGRAPMLISIAAGIRIAQLQEWIGDARAIVRAMPNTPALLGAGATGLFANAAASPEQRAEAEAILASAGRTAWIGREDLMDTVTALSGSGPAYFFLLVEALEDAAVAQGLPRDAARMLAAQTCFGAGRMLLEDGGSPAVLRERVTSPGGTTAAALDAFAAGGFRDLVATAVAAATERGRTLASSS